MKNKLTYDEAITRAEAIVKQLEQAEALSMDEYKSLAKEARELLEQCRKDIKKLDFNA